jgi:azurin/DNA-binding transcriptional ArsR family regulator
MTRVILGALMVALLGADTLAGTIQQSSAPKILLDQPLRAVEYQLDRLSSDELTRVERKDNDVRYRPIYAALLTRQGVGLPFRREAVAALTKLDKTSEARVLLDALVKVRAEDTQVGDQLVALLLAQSGDALRGQRDALLKTLEGSSPPLVRRGAYGALMIADGSPTQAWQAALAHEGHLMDLLRSVPQLPAGSSADALRTDLFGPISALIAKGEKGETRAAAIGALGWTRRDAATFRLLAQEVSKGSDEEARTAAIRSLRLIPESAWPKDEVEPLARAVVDLVRQTPSDRRTEASSLEAVQLGDRLAGVLPVETARAIRRDLRALGVQVVRIETVVEQMKFDRSWFAVEAGAAVQIVLVNPDAMPHNLVVGKPGSLQEIGTAGGAIPMPSDPAVKPFVPDTPLVLHATRLLQQGETEQLGFTAPKEPGEYVYLCTFPGHWVRMYGVMLVVEKLETWEANPTIPTDPMTHKPFAK